MPPPDRLTDEEIERLVDEVRVLRARIEEDWKAGKRDGMRLGIFSAAEALRKLVLAFDAGEVEAVRGALRELGHARLSLAANVGMWVREREGS